MAHLTLFFIGVFAALVALLVWRIICLLGLSFPYWLAVSALSIAVPMLFQAPGWAYPGFQAGFVAVSFLINRLVARSRRLDALAAQAAREAFLTAERPKEPWTAKIGQHSTPAGFNYQQLAVDQPGGLLDVPEVQPPMYFDTSVLRGGDDIGKLSLNSQHENEAG